MFWRSPVIKMRSSFSADFCKQMSAVGPFLKIHIYCRLKGGTDVQGGTPLEVIKVRQHVERILYWARICKRLWEPKETIPRNLFRRPMYPGGPVQRHRVVFRPDWESIPGLLKRSTNTGSGYPHKGTYCNLASLSNRFTAWEIYSTFLERLRTLGKFYLS